MINSRMFCTIYLESIISDSPTHSMLKAPNTPGAFSIFKMRIKGVLNTYDIRTS